MEMKFEINNKNKAKFFAQYWGNHVVCSHPEKSITIGAYGTVNVLTISEQYQGNFEKCCLLLKPLSTISDEDAVEVARRRAIVWSYSGQYVKNATVDDVIIVIDYLRSKGYALPWMGLSVEEMVEAGWIKLTT